MPYLASESIGEKAYYLLTALIKEEDDLTQVMLRAVSDKPHGLNGFLNETVADLRHVVETVQSAREIGVIKQGQVINIIDSVVQRTTFVGEEGGASVNIKDSLVHRTEIKGDEKKKKREEESLRREGEELERRQREEVSPVLFMQTETGTGNQFHIGEFSFDKKYFRKRRNDESDFERNAGYSVAFDGEKWTKGNAVEYIETPYGFIGISKTGVQRGISKQLKESLKKDITGTYPSDHLLSIKIAKKEGEKVQKPKNMGGIKKAIQEDDDLRKPRAEQEKFPNDDEKNIRKIADTDNYTNSIGMKLILIPSGEFIMGPEKDDQGKLAHKVKICKPFYLGIYPVTRFEWKQIMENGPSTNEGKDRPVENISWNDVQEFINKLNEKEKTNKYRLLSEAEWEYTARAGSKTRYFFGDDESKLGEYAWYSGNSFSNTHEVGKKKPNTWGLYDIFGNVFEWVQDKWHNDYKGAPTDGSAWESGTNSNRVIRGGSFLHDAKACRSAVRGELGSNKGSWNLGFRLARDV